MNRVLNLALNLRHHNGQLFIDSTLGSAWAAYRIELSDLEFLKGISLRTMDTQDSDSFDRLVRASVLGSGGWRDLQEIVNAESQLETERTHCVQLRLRVADDLWKVPWEAAFQEDELARMVSVVRMRHSNVEDLIHDEVVSVRLLEALTLDERTRFSRSQRQLLRKNALQVIAPPTLSRAHEVLDDDEPATFDVLHFAGHGGNNGIMLFDETAWQQSRDGEGESVGASLELSSDEFCRLVERWRVRVVVVAACGNPGTGSQWSLLERLIGVPSVKAVVGMREPIEAGVLARFCGDLYERLMNGEPLDSAVVGARWLLEGARSIPQLHLNVIGDLRVWKKTPEVLPAPVPAPVATLDRAYPLPLISNRGRLWQVRSNNRGRLRLFLLGSGAPGVAPEGTSVVVSPDARVAAAMTDDLVDIAWLVQSSMSLKSVPWGRGCLELPEQIRGKGARLIAASVLQDSTVRLVVATDRDTYWLFAVRGPTGTMTWRGLHALASEPASGALDVLPWPILVIDNQLDDPESRAPVFEGDPAAAMVDYAWIGDVRVAAAATIGLRGTIRVAREHSLRDWQAVPLVDNDERPAGVRGVAVVRQLQATVGLPGDPRNSPQVALVDAEGSVSLVEINLADSDQQSHR